MEAQQVVAANVQSRRVLVRKYSGIIYCLLAWFLFLCIILQIVLAGLAIFVDMAIWVKHIYFIYIFEFVPVIMFLLGCAAGFPRHLNRPNFVLFVLINIQYQTASGWMGVIHVLFALLLFLLTLSMAQRSYRYVFKKRDI